MATRRAGERLVVPGHPQYEPELKTAEQVSQECFAAIEVVTQAMMEIEAERLFG